MANETFLTSTIVRLLPIQLLQATSGVDGVLSRQKSLSRPAASSVYCTVC
jgi:hypothetical protein